MLYLPLSRSSAGLLFLDNCRPKWDRRPSFKLNWTHYKLISTQWRAIAPFGCKCQWSFLLLKENEFFKYTVQHQLKLKKLTLTIQTTNGALFYWDVSEDITLLKIHAYWYDSKHIIGNKTQDLKNRNNLRWWLSFEKANFGLMDLDYGYGCSLCRTHWASSLEPGCLIFVLFK